ncbi:MAG: type II secretion system GspH family protein [Candidatus Omnitrophica bacterium]|nr:type II secretion system GspH family protein [Candidatus Omnitrophota bacterium]MBU4477491.1 type II secretion system GspH family protein [Candidatus Omnitrophota bacterium]MCG2703727.1 type II secretion system GspH family protein [Candidatus Omnitrophota bacterium]
MNREQSSLTGFTLLELLVGITIFAIVIGGVYSSLYLGVKTWRQEESLDESYEQAFASLDLLARRLRCVFMNPLNADIKFSGSSESVDFFSVNREGDIENVVFYTQENEGGESFSLFQKRIRYLDLKGEAAAVLECINKNVKQFALSYFNAREQKWYDAWPEDLGLPNEVKIEISFADKYAKEAGRDMTKYVNISLANTIDFSGDEAL